MSRINVAKRRFKKRQFATKHLQATSQKATNGKESRRNDFAKKNVLNAEILCLLIWRSTLLMEEKTVGLRTVKHCWTMYPLFPKPGFSSEINFRIVLLKTTRK